MNFESSKTSDPHTLLINLTGKINVKRSDKYSALSNFSIFCTWKNIKSHTKIINLKYHLRHGMKSLNYLMDHVMCITLNTS